MWNWTENSKAVRILNHPLREIVLDLRLIASASEQRSVQELSTLIKNEVGNLLSYLRIIQSQVTRFSPFLRYFENVPPPGLISYGFGVVTFLHLHQPRPKTCRQPLLSQY